MFSSYPQLHQQPYDDSTVGSATSQPLGYGSAIGSTPVQTSMLGHPDTVIPYSYPPIAAHPQLYGNQPEHPSFPEMMMQQRKRRCIAILVIFIVFVIISVSISISNASSSNNGNDNKTNSHDDHHSHHDDHHTTEDPHAFKQKWLVLE
jgi:hypothetical protein